MTDAPSSPLWPRLQRILPYFSPSWRYAVLALLASTGAGVLWETLGAASTFYAGAIICVVTLIGMRVMPSAYRQD